MASPSLTFFCLPQEIRDQIYSYVYNDQSYSAKRMIITRYRLQGLRSSPDKLATISRWLFNAVAQANSRLRREFVVQIFRREVTYIHAGPTALLDLLHILYNADPYMPAQLHGLALHWEHFPRRKERANLVDNDLPELFNFLGLYCNALETLTVPTFYYAKSIYRRPWGNTYWAHAAIGAAQLLCDPAKPLTELNIVVRPYDLWAVMEPGFEPTQQLGQQQQQQRQEQEQEQGQQKQQDERKAPKEGACDWTEFLDTQMLHRDTHELGVTLRDYGPQGLKQASFRWRVKTSKDIDGGVDLVWTISMPAVDTGDEGSEGMSCESCLSANGLACDHEVTDNPQDWEERTDLG